MANKYNPKRKWQIICTEEKMRLMANCTEDCTRLLAGQTEMFGTMCGLDNYDIIRTKMEKEIYPLVVPALKATRSSYGWNGGDCPNKYQRTTIAQGYATYKSILSALANEYNWNNVHSGRPLTCQLGGELMAVRPLPQDEPKQTDYWTAANPDGSQRVYRSKPVRREYADGKCWEPSEGGWFYGDDVSKELIKMLGLPRLKWEDEPCHFALLTNLD